MALLDADSGERLGTLASVSGLDGAETVGLGGQRRHVLTLQGFVPATDSMAWPPQSKRCLSLRMQNAAGQVIVEFQLLGAVPLQMRGVNSPDVCSQWRIAGELRSVVPFQTAELLLNWCAHFPQTRGEWGNRPFDERNAWLEAARIAHCSGYGMSARPDVSGALLVIEGRYITDYPSFFLALGEAVNGPAGYFGACLDSLEDCLCGGFGAVPPFRLTWRDSEVAQRCLTAEAWADQRRFWREYHGRRLDPNDAADGADWADVPLASLFDEIVAVLARHHVELVLA